MRDLEKLGIPFSSFTYVLVVLGTVKIESGKEKLDLDLATGVRYLKFFYMIPFGCLFLLLIF